MSEFDIILDNSRQNLKEVPSKILSMCNLKMLYLQQNLIKKLPNDFFLRLPLLSWLDLRHNQLTKIPESIAHHQHLENLLLTDNRIETLPNELGLVRNLKVLQIANNPITYPNNKIISLGTRAVCGFLKSQYDKEIASMNENVITKESEDSIGEYEQREERQIRVVETFSKEFYSGEPISSSLMVRGLSKEKNGDKIIHKMTRDKNGSKISLKSYFDDDHKYTQTSDYNIISKRALQQDWLEKLASLLEQQQRILQQERNLQELTSWRYRKKSEPIRTVHQSKPRAPYATYPEYESVLSREDLSKQIDRLIERSRNQPKQENVEKLINDLISQLKEMETTYSGIKSPRSEIEAAGTEIMKIMEIHKKLIRLQQVNKVSQ